MPPKRAKATGSSKSDAKRVKHAFLDSDSESPTVAAAKLSQKKTIVLPGLDNSEDEEPLVRHRNTKQPQPKPKKKTNLMFPELKISRPQQQQQQQQPSVPTQNKQSSVLKTKTTTRQENQENQEIQSTAFSNGSTGSSKAKNEGKRSKNTKSPSSMSVEQLTAALEDLNVKYNRLKQLRVTEAEKNLADCRDKLEEATRSAENYRAQMEPQLESALRVQEKLRDNNEVINAKVRTLQRQVRGFEEQIRQRDQADRVKAKTASMEAVLASPDVTPTSAANASTIKMYENLSGLKIAPRDIYPRPSKETLPTIWDCERSGSRGTLRFTLTYDFVNSVVSYTPCIDKKKDGELLETLPDYVTDEIEFEQVFESKFFWTMLNFNDEDSRRQ